MSSHAVGFLTLGTHFSLIRPLTRVVTVSDSFRYCGKHVPTGTVPGCSTFQRNSQFQVAVPFRETVNSRLQYLPEKQSIPGCSTFQRNSQFLVAVPSRETVNSWLQYPAEKHVTITRFRIYRDQLVQLPECARRWLLQCGHQHVSYPAEKQSMMAVSDLRRFQFLLPSRSE